MFYFLSFVAAALVVIVFAYLWLFRSLAWIGRQTKYDAFFSLPLAQRRALRRQIEGKARWIRLLVLPMTRLGASIPVVDFEGTKVPGICPPETMAFARDYEPEEGDIFVATQMKCGTTWMQQIVFQILTRGKGEFSDEGYRHMHAISPWIESAGSVRLADAPRIEGKRIIKTHLATRLCPWSDKAKYIYVVRHPAACLASSVDFVSKLMGPMAPQRDDFVGWFCSDDMWWGHWADHAEGWWRWSEEHDNVLFVHYEKLLADPEAEISRIADFLGVDLSDEGMAKVLEKSGYQYMKANDHYFEMSAPTPMDTGDNGFFVKGSSNRGDDISDADRERVLKDAAERLRDGSYPAVDFYPDLYPENV